MTLQSVPQTMPMVMPVSSQQQQPAQQQPLYKTNHNDIAIQRKLEEQEKKLAERQAELAKLSEKLDTLKREQKLEEERSKQRQQQQQEQQQQQQQQRNQERLQQNQSSRPTQPAPPKTTSWNQSNGSEYLSNKPARFVNHPLSTGHSDSFLKSRGGDVPPPSEFRDSHPVPPSQPARNTTAPAPPSPPTTNGEYVDGPVLKTRPDGRTASVVLAVHTQKASPHTPTKVYHAPNQADLATTSFTVMMTEKSGRTQLYRKSAGPYLTYQNVKWKLFLRKEVRNPLDQGGGVLQRLFSSSANPGYKFHRLLNLFSFKH